MNEEPRKSQAHSGVLEASAAGCPRREAGSAPPRAIQPIVGGLRENQGPRLSSVTAWEWQAL